MLVSLGQVKSMFFFTLLVTFFSGESIAVELSVVDSQNNKIEPLINVEFSGAKRVKKLLTRYREKPAYLLVRDSIERQDFAENVVEAKRLIEGLQIEYQKLKSVEAKTMETYAWMSNLSIATSEACEVIAAMGTVEDGYWMVKKLETYYVGRLATQVFERHGLKFKQLRIEDKQKWRVAEAMAMAGDRTALAWLLEKSKMDPPKDVKTFFKLLVLQKHPLALFYSKRIIDNYKSALVTGKHPRDLYQYQNALPWAILQIVCSGDSEYLTKIERMYVSEMVANTPIFVSSLKDPKPIFESLFGAKGRMAHYEKNALMRVNWVPDILRAALVGREADEANVIEVHYTSLLRAFCNKEKVFSVGVPRLVNHLTDQVVDLKLSALRPSLTAARLVTKFSSSQNTSFRFRHTPWIKMEWNASLVLNNVSNLKTRRNSDSRVSPFRLQQVEKVLNNIRGGHTLSRQVFSLNHRCINKNFETPHHYKLGVVYSPAVKLSKKGLRVGVHSVIQVITPKVGTNLTVGFKVKSVHYDDGGLGSAIAQTHLKLKGLKKDFCRSQIQNVRYKDKEGTSVQLKFLRSTKGGIHLFSGDFPKDGVNDVVLYFDWCLIDEKYTLCAGLYEPWFALKK